MGDIFADATGVNPENLNKLISSGGGVLTGYHYFSILLEIFYDGADYKYKLRTSNNEVANLDYFGNLGATHNTTYTNVGDGNVDKVSAGRYKIILSGVTQIFVLAVINSTNDLNIVRALALPPTSGSIDYIDCFFRNSSDTDTDPASGKIIAVDLMGLYK